MPISCLTDGYSSMSERTKKCNVGTNSNRNGDLYEFNYTGI